MDVKSLPWAPSPWSPSCVHSLVHCRSVTRWLQSAFLVPGPAGREQRGLCSPRARIPRGRSQHRGPQRDTRSRTQDVAAHVEASERAVHRVCQAGQARAPPRRRARLHRVESGGRVRSHQLGLGHRKRGCPERRPPPGCPLSSVAGASRADCAVLT